MHRRDMEPPRLPEVEVTRIAQDPRMHETRGQTRDPVLDEGLRTQGRLPSSLVRASTPTSRPSEVGQMELGLRRREVSRPESPPCPESRRPLYSADSPLPARRRGW